MRKYEVTIPFNRPYPHYTGYAIAINAVEAISMIKQDALKGGFYGKHGKPEVKVVDY